MIQTTPPFRQRLHGALNNTWFTIPLALLILLSVFLIVAEFFVPVGPTRVAIESTNDILTAIFIAELLMRSYAAPSRKVFLKNYWLDILSVLPVFRAARALRVFRLLRVLRVGRALIILLRHGGWLSRRAEQSVGGLSMLLFVSFVLVVSATLTSLTFETKNSFEPIAPVDFVHRSLDISMIFAAGEVGSDVPGALTHKVLNLLVSLAGLVVFALLVGMIAATMSNYLRMQMERKDVAINDLHDHLIVCGWGRTGELLLKKLMKLTEVWQRGVVVVTEEEIDLQSIVPNNKAGRLFHLRGDYTKFDVLESCVATKARTAVVLADSSGALRDQDRDARTVLAALTLEKLNPDIHTCAELIDEQNKAHLEIAGVEEVISHSEMTAGLMLNTAVQTGLGGTLLKLLSAQTGAGVSTIAVPESCLEKAFVDALTFCKKELNATILAVHRLVEGSTDSQSQVEHLLNPPHDLILRATDRLVVLRA